MVLVDDVVADAQVGEARECPAEPAVGAWRPLSEDLRVGQEHEAELAPHEAAPGRGDREAQPGLGAERLAAVEERRLHLAQEGGLALRLPPVHERDDDPVSRSDERSELVLGLGEAASGDRRALSLEGVRLRLREGIELRRTVERQRCEPFLLRHATYLVRLPDEVGPAADRRNEVGRNLRNRRPRVLLTEIRLDEVDTSLARRIDHRVVGGMKGALRERRERADLLDLVTVELDAERLPPRGREDVDDPAADGELPALVDSVDSVVARERERLRKPFRARLVPDPQLDGGGPRLRRWQPLRQGGDRRADKPTGLEHPEGPVPLADEVRRRLETGLERDAPARKERDPGGVTEPRRTVRCVPRVRVLRQENEECATELLVERGEEQRENGLRDARARRQRSDEPREALVPAQLVHEGGERRGVRSACNGRVHASGGDRPRGAIVVRAPLSDARSTPPATGRRPPPTVGHPPSSRSQKRLPVRCLTRPGSAPNRPRGRPHALLPRYRRSRDPTVPSLRRECGGRCAASLGAASQGDRLPGVALVS